MQRNLLIASLVTALVCPAAWAAAKINVEHQTANGYTYYRYTITGLGAAETSIHINVNEDFNAALEGSTVQPAAPSGACPDPCWSGTPASATLVLELRGRTSETTPTAVDYIVGSDPKGTTLGPSRAFDPQFFSVLIGSGSLITSRAAQSYQVVQNTNVLSLQGLGRNNLDLLVGGSFNLGFLKGGHGDIRQPWTAFISLKFTPGSANTINGFVFGAGYRLTKYLDVIAGVGLTPRMEPSIGLRRAAYQTLVDYGKEDAFKRYAEVKDDILLYRNNAWDGFPLQRNGAPIYTGTPLLNHYRTGAFIGVAFPLTIKAALAGR